MFELHFSSHFLEEQKKMTQKDPELKYRIVKGLLLLAQDPRNNSLKTHKVQTKELGVKFSSWLTGDLRVIWEFDESHKMVILILDIGGHSGNAKVYK